jgi:hypothetical protein
MQEEHLTSRLILLAKTTKYRRSSPNLSIQPDSALQFKDDACEGGYWIVK